MREPVHLPKLLLLYSQNFSPEWIFLIVLLSSYLILAEEECTADIDCFECKSDVDLRCRDPFNKSSGDLPPIKKCKGCCVKIVQNHYKENEVIWRTCIASLEISMFLVDHVCMRESNGNGHMCFCEENKCNGSTTNFDRNAPMLCAFLILLSALAKAYWRRM